MLTALAGAAGFLWFVAEAERQPAPPPAHADGIVVLTGGAERVETGLRLLSQGHAGLLLVTGVAHGADLPELAHLAGVDPAKLTGRVSLGHLAVSTRGNAMETQAWVERHAIRSLIVVTAFYHMPRALAELRQVLPGVELHPVVVQPGRARAWRLLADEYVKYLAVKLGLAHLVPAREGLLPHQRSVA
jgi:uncharacterized SAM-binding protein YcdF (DUF218 family)